MAVTKWAVYAVKVASVVWGVTGTVAMEDAPNVVKEANDGSGGVRIVALLTREQKITFSTRQIDTVLDTCGTIGVDLSTISGGVTLYCVKLGQVARVAGSVHRSFAATKGMMYVSGISASQSGLAAASVVVDPLSTDGDAVAVTESATATLPSVSTPTRVFTLGDVGLNGTLQEGLQSMSLTLNQGVDKAPYDGGVYATCSHIDEGSPVVELETAEAGGLASLLSTGGVTVSSNVDVFLRGCQNLNMPYAKNEEEHVRLRIAAGLIVRGGVSGERLAMAKFTVHAAKTGSTQMVQYAKDVAIA